MNGVGTSKLWSVFALWLPVCSSQAIAQGMAAAADPRRGEYLLHAGGCIACHTEAETLKANGPILGGGRALKTPFGTFYGPNITKDPTHGIGRWSDSDFIAAFRHGRSPAGHNYYPAFPYTSFTGISDRDLLDLKAYIFTLPAVARPSRAHDIDFPYGWRFPLTFWKWLNFDTGPYNPNARQSAQWNRGAYLVNHLAHCVECHTPRDFIGARVDSRHLSGNRDGPEGSIVPNITPDEETGIGKWSESDLVTLLKSGMTPDNDFVGRTMSEVVTLGTSKLSDEDLTAIVLYLKSVPAIRNKVEKRK